MDKLALGDKVDWQGGDCPLDSEVPIIAYFRDGLQSRARLAGTFRWQHIDQNDDIVAYQVYQDETISSSKA